MTREPLPLPDRTAPWWPALDDVLTSALVGVPNETREFFRILFGAYPPARSVRHVAELLTVSAPMLKSRLVRAGLPSAAVLVDQASLVRLAFVLDDPTLSVAEAASLLHYSASQNLHRHLVGLTGLTPTEWRQQWTGRQRAAAFVAMYIAPHIEAWRTTNLLGPRLFVPRPAPAVTA
jgi:AraC-like DNA-binding protein